MLLWRQRRRYRSSSGLCPWERALVLVVSIQSFYPWPCREEFCMFCYLRWFPEQTDLKGYSKSKRKGHSYSNAPTWNWVFIIHCHKNKTLQYWILHLSFDSYILALFLVYGKLMIWKDAYSFQYQAHLYKISVIWLPLFSSFYTPKNCPIASFFSSSSFDFSYSIECCHLLTSERFHRQSFRNTASVNKALPTFCHSMEVLRT